VRLHRAPINARHCGRDRINRNPLNTPDVRIYLTDRRRLEAGKTGGFSLIPAVKRPAVWLAISLHSTPNQYPWRVALMATIDSTRVIENKSP
jgi:hypothetical protein